MAKRSADDGIATIGQPPIKKVQFEPHLIGPVSTLEELDIKVLQFQNKKLAQVNKALKCWNFNNLQGKNGMIFLTLKFFLLYSVLSSGFDVKPNSGNVLNNWKSVKPKMMLF